MPPDLLQQPDPIRDKKDGLGRLVCGKLPDEGPLLAHRFPDDPVLGDRSEIMQINIQKSFGGLFEVHCAQD